MTRADLIVRGGHLVLSDEVRRADLVITAVPSAPSSRRMTRRIGPTTRSTRAAACAAGSGRWPCPFQRPRPPEREGYLTGTRAAAAGGVTTVIDMPLSCSPLQSRSTRCA